MASSLAKEDLQRIRFVTAHFGYFSSYSNTRNVIAFIYFTVVWFFTANIMFATAPFTIASSFFVLSNSKSKHNAKNGQIITWPALGMSRRILFYVVSFPVLFIIWLWANVAKGFPIDIVNVALAVLIFRNWLISPNRKLWSYYLLLVLGLVVLAIWPLVSPNSLIVPTIARNNDINTVVGPNFALHVAVLYYDCLLYLLISSIGDYLLLKKVFKYKPQNNQQRLNHTQVTVSEAVLEEVLALLSACSDADLTALQRLTGIGEEKLKVMLDQMVDMELIRLTVKPTQGTNEKSKFMASITSKGREVLG